MTKKIDTNGFWEIKRNPISKVGVFPYLGRQISDECEPDKIYKVYRSAETLKKSVPTWDNPPKPFIEEHEMLGEGFTNIDDRPVQGIIYNPEFDEDTGVLYADMAIYSEDMKDKISNGKKEISLGYFCKYEKRPGVFNGEVYDYEQIDMVGNHGALVDAGRCGSDVKVFDKALRSAFDAMEISPNNFVLNKNSKTVKIISKDESITKDMTMSKYVLLDDVKEVLKKGLQWDDQETPTQKLITDLLDEKAIEIETAKAAADEDVDKREAIRKVMAIAAKPNDDFDGGEEEKIETIAKILEKSEYNKSEAGTANDEDDEDKDEKKSEDKCGKDKKARDEDDKDNDSNKEVMDSLKKIAKGIDKLLARDEESKEDDAKKSDAEDEDEDENGDGSKKAEDAAVVVVAEDARIVSFSEDAALNEYLGKK